jgi:Flp pilus assembly protein TadB
METALLVLAVAAAGLACPAMMWWQRRRGRRASCCVPARPRAGSDEGELPSSLEELRAYERSLATRLAELDREQEFTPADERRSDAQAGAA